MGVVITAKMLAAVRRNKVRVFQPTIMRKNVRTAVALVAQPLRPAGRWWKPPTPQDLLLHRRLA